jgi:hypothetical protein
MSDIKFNPRTLTLIFFIVVIGLTRVLIPLIGDLEGLANYTAVGALAIFGAAHFNNNIKSFSFPILTLLLSDVILSLTVYKEFSNGFLYEGWYWVYAAFAIMVLAGRVIMKKVNVLSFLAATLAIVLIHWIVTDFGIWYGSAVYPQTLAGFWVVLANAIPFEFRFLYGTLGYGAVMFGLFEVLKLKFPVLNFQSKRQAETL